MELTKQTETEVLKAYHAYWDSYLSGDMQTFASMLAEDCHIIGSTKFDVFDNKKSAVEFYAATAAQISGKAELRNRNIKLLPYPDSVMVEEHCDFYFLDGGEWNFYAHGRISTLFSKSGDGWKIIYQHGSLPDSRAEQGEQIAAEKISEENRLLREAVQRRTIELEQKNRELKIEAALERVRAVAISMTKREELLEIGKVLFHELTLLGFDSLRNVMINTFNDEQGFFTDYDYSDFHGGVVTKINYHGHPLIEKYIAQIKTAKDAFSEVIVADGDLESWIINRRERGEPDDPRLLNISSLHYYQYSVGTAAIGMSSFSPLSNDNREVMRRFRNVFDFAYKRYEDVSTALVQAREAQIQLALERVRARTMAMQRSEELSEAANLLFQQVNALCTPVWSCGYNIWEIGDTECTGWMSSQGIIQPSFRFPLTENPTFIRLAESRKNNIEFYEEEVGGEELVEHYRYMTELPGFKEILGEFHAAGFNLPQTQVNHVANFRHGNLIFISSERVPDGHDLFKRFAKVFEQTYMRFLDLKKAESQAREAQIEAALERVRSKAMAMHSSQDLADTIGVFYHELHSFSITPIRCGVGLLDREERVGELFTWNTTEQGKSLELVGRLKMEGHLVLNHVYENWLSQTEYFPVLRGNEIKEYYQVLRPQMAFPDYSHDDVQYGYFFFFKEGGVYAWTKHEMTEEELQIYRRFKTVLSLTYKRYRDLQQAEGNAREAQIETALEKVRSRTLAMQKSDELAEAAAEIFRQLIGLGIEPNRLYIGIVKDETGDVEMWATEENGDHLGQKFTFNKNENASVEKLYEGWVSQLKSRVVDMQGKELEEYLTYLHDVLKLPVKDAQNQKRRIQSVAYFSKGFIGIASHDEQPPASVQLLERFAAVFNLTFTRFNDLKIAEAHALQAEEDLIKLQAEKKRAEEALTELRSTQAQLIQSEKMASLGQLTAGIAHEIQNPLNFVNNFSEVSGEMIQEAKALLASHGGQGKRQKAKENSPEVTELLDDIEMNLEKINHHGKRADAIVKGMLEHSRSTSGNFEPTDVNALAEEYFRLAYHGMRGKDHSFQATMKTEFDESVGRINIVPQDIGRVLLNLFNNAFYAVHARASAIATAKADASAFAASSADKLAEPTAVSEKNKNSKEDYSPEVELRTEKKDGMIVLAVRDNGDGIPEKIKDKIFQPFFTTKPTGQGTGLGLSLAYDIIKAHNGEIQVRNLPDCGAEISVTLPINI